MLAIVQMVPKKKKKKKKRRRRCTAYQMFIVAEN